MDIIAPGFPASRTGTRQPVPTITKEEAFMEEVSIVGVDLANQVFQVHGATADGRVLFRKKLLSAAVS